MRLSILLNTPLRDVNHPGNVAQVRVEAGVATLAGGRRRHAAYPL
ncbi:MAG TPA: hypothetical protein VNH38_05105 [Candidatus Dormibacteraeota bacterium]|nr:hypothetical protein [Candidatus Dormibacteraeota bacterium]